MMNAWFQLLRVPNIILAISTAWLLYQSIIKSLAFRFDLSVALSNFELTLFLIALSMVMMGAYIINDIKDLEVDVINRPDRPIPSGAISTRMAFSVYIWLLIIGTLISIFTSWSINRNMLAILYPLSFLILYLYSVTFKSSILIGNLLISLLCSCIPIVLIIAEWEIFNRLRQQSNLIFALYSLLLYFSVYFIFMTTFIREIIKDAEDMEGDKTNNIVTLATKYGTDTSAIVSNVLTVVLLCSFVYWIYLIFPYLSIGNIVTSLIIVFFMTVTIKKLSSTQLENTFKSASMYMKWTMIAGLVHIIWAANSF